MQNRHDSFEAAREQAAEYLGFTASEFIKTASGGVWEIPNPSFLDDDQRARYDRLQFEMENWDRHDDVLNDDGSVKVRGALKEPYRKDGELVEHFEIQLAKAIFGDRYDEFKADGGRASDVNNIWWKMNRMLAKRRETDSKSDGGAEPVAVVPDSD